MVIVGAGLAGLACGVHLTERGIPCRIFEASDGVGGRVRTDRVDVDGLGRFQLDRGFQVFLQAYPEAQRMLDYDRLDLRPFAPGALVRRGGRFHRLVDPFRRPFQALGSLFNPVGSMADKLRMLRLRRRALSTDLFQGPETTVEEALRRLGFSDSMIDGFFRPFLGGILLDPSLATSSYLLDFVLRWMARGDVSVPARGMGALSEQLAGRLPAGTVWLDSSVRRVEAGAVELEGGARVEGRSVVVATEGPVAARLLGGAEAPALPDPGSKEATCLYFATEEAPVEGPWLVLDGEPPGQAGPVRNLAVMDRVAPGYAPQGWHLVSATVLEREGFSEDGELQGAVLHQMEDWFGGSVSAWRHLATYRIPHAQPAQPPGFRQRGQLAPRLREGLYLAGDWLESASIQGALVSGREVAEALVAEGGRP